MHKLNQNSKLLEIKQNLIDEIPFLFFEDYNQYINVAKAIINYKIENERKEYFYWDLIDYLLNLIKLSDFFKNKKITMEFDQYNQTVDIYGDIFFLYQKLEVIYIFSKIEC